MLFRIEGWEVNPYPKISLNTIASNHLIHQLLLTPLTLIMLTWCKNSVQS
jgi:hypothetical protein